MLDAHSTFEREGQECRESQMLMDSRYTALFKTKFHPNLSLQLNVLFNQAGEPDLLQFFVFIW